ncbi:unnamed protein product [Boreogadus saida]
MQMNHQQEKELALLSHSTSAPQYETSPAGVWGPLPGNKASLFPRGLGRGSRVWPSSTDGSGRALGATASPGRPEQGAGPVAQSRAFSMKPGLLHEAGPAVQSKPGSRARLHGLSSRACFMKQGLLRAVFPPEARP